MARLDYVKPGANAEADAAFAQVGKLGRPVLNLYAELANHPPALEAFLSMSRYVRDGSSLEPGLRELLILATARALQQEYEIVQHTAAAKRAGVSDEKLAGAGLSDREACAVEYAREAARDRTCSDATFRRMQSLFSTAELVDLVVTAAWYHLCAVILGTFEIEPESAAR